MLATRTRPGDATEPAPPARPALLSRGSPARLATGGTRAARLVRWLRLTAIALALLTALLYLVLGTGPTLAEIPWFGAFVLNLQALTCLTASVLMLGRHRVLHDPTCYWTGIGFSIYGLALVFYVLAWPGLLPDGGSFIATLPGTSAWFTLVAGAAMGGFLLAASLVRWPKGDALRGGRWIASVFAWLVAAAVLCAMIVAIEERLPPLVRPDGTFTPLLAVSNGTLAALLFTGIVVSARHSRRTGDPLPALAAFLPLALGCVYLWVLIGAQRYGIWWYLGRALLTAGALTVLFGLLSEHVALMRRELERTRSLQDADRRKNEFLAMLSHELRNPLATISTVLYMLNVRGTDDPAVARAQEAAIRQSTHMRRLLDDLLDVSRITHGTITLNRDRVDLADVARAAVEALQPQLDAKGQTLRTALVPLRVDGDAVRLTQAISNLLHNAAKYTPAGGNIRLTLGAENSQAIVRVTDSGIGIEPELLPSLFDLFVQGDRSLDRSEGGLGIGLTVSRTLVEMHGGTIEASSDGAGRGSEFVIRLPRAGSAHPGPMPDTPPAPAVARRILLVEDDPDAAASLAALLETEGHSVRTARSGEEALELVKGFDAEVVLLDLGLPGMDGYETASRLREQSSFAAAAFIALTGYGRDQDLAQSRAAGFASHLLKPVALEDLRRAVDALTARTERLTPR